MSIFRLYRTSIGKKYVMAITGALVFLFVIVHMLGNLQIYLGPDKLNAYAEFLKSQPALLWGTRIGLLVLVIAHIIAALHLAAENRRARAQRYEVNKVVASTLANRTILFSGLIILAFILYHLAHFTIGLVDPQYLQYRDAMGRHDVYRMMVVGFSYPVVSGFYIIAMALLCLHLSHGVSSMFQSLGLRREGVRKAIDRFAKIAALVIFIGNVSIPVSVLAGLIK